MGVIEVFPFITKVILLVTKVFPLVTNVFPLVTRVFPLLTKVLLVHIHPFEVRCDEQTDGRTHAMSVPFIVLDIPRL